MHTWLRDNGSGLSKVLVTKGDLQLHRGQAASSTGLHIPMASQAGCDPVPCPPECRSCEGPVALLRSRCPADSATRTTSFQPWKCHLLGPFRPSKGTFITSLPIISSPPHHHRSSRDAEHLLVAVGCPEFWVTQVIAPDADRVLPHSCAPYPALFPTFPVLLWDVAAAELVPPSPRVAVSSTAGLCARRSTGAKEPSGWH